MGKVGKWIKNARPIALAQSMLPAVLAVVMAIGEPRCNLILGLIAVLGVAAAHLALNLCDDYFDYKVDMKGDRDRVVRQGFRAMTVKYPYLADGSATLRQTRNAILDFGAFAAVCGLVIFILRTDEAGLFAEDGSWWILAIVALTAFLGFFYSAPPLKLAYRGWGELIIGLIFGPLLMMGVYYSACGRVDLTIVGISVPVGILVMNILFTHSFIDKAGDEASNKMTFARLLGSDRLNLAAAYCMNLLPFLLVVLAVALSYLHPLYLLVLLVLPRAIWLCRSLKAFSDGKVDVTPTPPAWLGRLGNWAEVRAAGIDWFLLRWLTARNLLSGFCALTILAKLILLLLNLFSL